jgi:thiosulfate/3-mercaptopyruvate sulfurtransferase
MAYTTIISTSELSQHLADPNWAPNWGVVDCRFALADVEKGRRDYQEAHIAGAVYAHLDDDLSGHVIPGRTGRHPLPDINSFAQTLSSWGIDSQVQVVAYDDAGGAIAARLWWMLRWLGHEAVAVLDGGWPAWQNDGRPERSGIETRPARTFSPNPQPHLLVEVDEVERIRTDSAFHLIDSRSADRYRGENETIDPVAGHIPGAVSGPFANNLDEAGCFQAQAALKARFQDLLGNASPESAVFYCGSGVTAAHNLLAMAYAGLGDGRLYAGSWSEWIADPERPVATE